LTAAAEITLRATRQSGSIRPCLELRDAGATGSLAAACGEASALVERTLPAGNYLVLVNDSGDDEGSYELELDVPAGVPNIAGRWVCRSTDQFNCLLSGSGSDTDIDTVEVSQNGSSVSFRIESSCFEPPSFSGEISGCQVLLNRSWQDACEGEDCTATVSCVIAGCAVDSRQMDCAATYSCSETGGPDRCTGTEVLACVKE
jgi:hypothetical protein